MLLIFFPVHELCLLKSISSILGKLLSQQLQAVQEEKYYVWLGITYITTHIAQRRSRSSYRYFLRFTLLHRGRSSCLGNAHAFLTFMSTSIQITLPHYYNIHICWSLWKLLVHSMGCEIGEVKSTRAVTMPVRIFLFLLLLRISIYRKTSLHAWICVRANNLFELPANLFLKSILPKSESHFSRCN